ncbi:MAG: large subunit ribosomal protein [Miltoncostaeaceae bacterium]|jgi:large subunit ribosomal protein L35|nr:large subunit ribosomal protein [Miltoncostaeaceae bacterium]
MPKMKTKRAAKKRFKVTGTGKLRFQRAGLRHNLERKNGKLQRQLGQEAEVASELVPTVKRLLGRR